MFASFVARCLVIIVLLAAGEAAAAGYDPHRLGDDVRPLRQELWLEIDADQPGYHGRTVIEVEIRRPLAAFRMHAQDMEITAARLDGEDFEGKLLHRADEAGLVIMSAPMVLAEGRYRLSIEFRNEFSTNSLGLYRTVQGGQGYVFSQLQDVEARRAFPCFDEPAFKHPWQVTVRAPEEYLVVHNTPASSEQVTDGWRETVFAETRPLPSYLIALASGPFATVEMPGLGVPGRIVLMPGQEPYAGLALELTPPLLAAFEDYFGEPYPYEKLDFIASPDFWYGAMENPGAVVFLDRLLLVDPERPSVGQRRALARIIAHELAHMWFGNMVTLAWWDDLWLNESFADWLGTRIADDQFPQLGVRARQYAASMETMRDDGRATAQAIRSSYRAADDFTRNLALKYSKGNRVLAMFEAHLGAEKFREGVRAYLAAHRWDNASAEDLWRALAARTGADVPAAIASFIEQPGLPLVTVTRGAAGLEVSQRRYAPFETELPEQTWQIPVALRYALEGEEQQAQVLLGPEPATLPLDGALDWVVPNAGGAGYYRWHLDSELQAALLEAPVTPLERVDLLGNLAALLDAGSMDGAAYLVALRAVGADAEGVVLDQLIARLKALREPFGEGQSAAAFRSFLRATLSPALERSGALPRAGEPEEVAAARPELLRILGVDGRDATVAAFAAELARQYLGDPSSLAPELAMAALEVYARRGSEELQQELMRRAAATADPAQRNVLLAAVAAFHAVPLQQAALEHALSDAVNPREKWDQLWRVAAVPGRRDELLDWLFANYDAVTSGFPPERLARMPLFAGGCSVGRLARARQFFADPARRVPDTEYHLERVADAVRQCAALRQREGERVSAWLAQGNGTG